MTAGKLRLVKKQQMADGRPQMMAGKLRLSI
jgi:hypothetical protein